jgi:tetratricopeptide (TPR) repeat protein
LLDKALEIDHNNVTALANKGWVLDGLGKHREAINVLDKALEIDGNYSSAWYGKGLALNSLGKRNEAIQCYDKAIKIDADKANAWYYKGLALDYLGEYEEAIQCYDKALELNPNYILAKIKKSNLLNKQKKKKGWFRLYMHFQKKPAFQSQLTTITSFWVYYS